MSPRLLFPQDKNYILKEAQENSRASLLNYLAETIRSTYLNNYNPLGLEDDTIRTIRNCKQMCVGNLEPFYYELAAIYRYKIGSNQLELIFSGKSHYDKYLDDWKEAFEIWTEDFVDSPYFVRAVLQMTILQPDDRCVFLAGNRLKVYLTQYFNLKVYKYRGILPTKAA